MYEFEAMMSSRMLPYTSAETIGFFKQLGPEDRAFQRCYYAPGYQVTLTATPTRGTARVAIARQSAGL
jgi:hypothetical protein